MKKKDSDKIDSTQDNNEYKEFSINDNEDPYSCENFEDIPILSIVEKSVNQIEDNEKKLFINKFIATFKAVLLKQASENMLHYLPKPIFTQLKKETFLIEWIFDKFRIGFSFEENLNDAFYYIVSKKEMEDINLSSALTEKNMENVVNNTIEFAIKHL